MQSHDKVEQRAWMFSFSPFNLRKPIVVGALWFEWDAKKTFCNCIHHARGVGISILGFDVSLKYIRIERSPECLAFMDMVQKEAEKDG